MNETERRTAYRVAAPADFLKEVAIWVGQQPTQGKLHIGDLGPPHFISQGHGDDILLEDVSTRGLGLSFTPTAVPTIRGMRNAFLYVYLKLHAPLVSSGVSQYCLFMGANAVRVAFEDGRLHLGLKIILRGIPEKQSKALTMFNAERFGIKELTRWCDDMARAGRGLNRPLSPGLDIEHLLTEIAAARSAAGVPDRLQP